jgi:hypothetical protein
MASEPFAALLAKVRRTANFCPSAERTTLHALLDSLAAAHAAEVEQALASIPLTAERIGNEG